MKVKIAANPGDFLIVSGVSRPVLVKCIEFNAKQCSGYLDVPSKEDDSKTVSFVPKDIVANLGKFPRAGTAFGVKIEPLLKTIKDKRFGEIRVYQKLKEEKLEHLQEELTAFWDVIKQRGHKVKYELEVRNPQGKYAGYYKYLPKGDFDICCIKPDTDLAGLQYILFHEHGHGVWGRRVNDKIKAKWIACYHEYVNVQDVDQDTLDGILADVTAQGSLREYLKDCTVDIRPIVNSCIKHISTIHGISKHNLELLLNRQESIEDFWPLSMEISEKQVAISEYARKSTEEFFAESYAFHLLGRPLPKKVALLIDSTLAKLVK